MTETERREASECLHEWLMQQPGVSLTSAAAKDTVFFDDFSEWFSTTLFSDLHNCVGDRLIDYSLSSSLHANRAIPKRQLDKKLDKKTAAKQHKPPRGSHVPYQKDLLHPADLFNNQSNYDDYVGGNSNSNSNSGSNDHREDSSYAVNTRLRGLPPPPLVQVPALDSSMSFLNLFGDIISPTSPPPRPGSEHYISPSFNHPRMPSSNSFIHNRPPTISVPSLINPFEGIDPFFHSSTLPRMPKPLTRNDSFYSHDGSDSEGSVNNQPYSPDIIKKSKKHFSWM